MQKTFKAVAPDDFKEQMISYWMRDESVDRETAIGYYAGNSFDALCARLIGNELVYQMDDAETCFESVDNNFVIPISILNTNEGKQ